MAAYNALFDGSSTTLASYTSDSGHTHTLQSGSGTLRTDGSGFLEAVTSGQSAYYTSNYTPPSPAYSIAVTFNIRDLGSFIIGAGLRAQTDGDRLEVRSNGFENLFELVEYTDAGATETIIDTVAAVAGTRVVEIEVDSGLNYEWFLDTVSQGTGTIDSSLSAAGTICYSKFSENLTGGERLMSVSVTEGGGTNIDVTGVVGVATASGPTPGVTTVTRPYTIITIA